VATTKKKVDYSIQFSQVGADGVKKSFESIKQASEKLNQAQATGKNQGMGIGAGTERRRIAIQNEILDIEKKIMAAEQATGEQRKKLYAEVLEKISSVKTSQIKLVEEMTKFTGKIGESTGKLKPLLEDLEKTGQSITLNAQRAEELKQKLESIKVTFADDLAKATQAAGLKPGDVDTKRKAEDMLSKRKDRGRRPGQSDAQYKEEIKGLEKIVALYDQYEKGLRDVQTEIKQSRDLLKQKQKAQESIIGKIETELGKNKKLTDEQKQTIRSVVAALRSLGQISFDESARSLDNLEDSLNSVETEQRRVSASTEPLKRNFIQNAIAATLYYAAIRTLRRIFREVVSVVSELDKSLTQVAMVTNMNREEAWSLVDSYQNLANQVGSTTTEIAKLSVYFFRQGLATEEAMRMTEVAAIAAKVASIDATESANYLTSAINGFNLAATDAMGISDKFAALGANSASSYEEMAVALSKVAPVAKTAGVNIDQMMAFLAKGIETTREAPENIGTAFKTVFARMTQIKDFGKTMEDGMSVNTVEEALKQAGVALRNEDGTFRQMGDVIIELGHNFESLNRNQQAYIATALAGTRQQSRLLAVLQDFDRTMELVDVSTNSAGTTMLQHTEYAQSMEAAMNGLKTSFESLITSMVESEFVISVIDFMSDSINVLSGIMDFATNNAVTFVTTVASLALVFLAVRASMLKLIATQKIKNALDLVSAGLHANELESAKATLIVDALRDQQKKKGVITTLYLIAAEKIRALVTGKSTVATVADTAATVVDTAATVANTAATGTQTAVNAVATTGFWALASSIWLTVMPLLVMVAAIAIVVGVVYGLIKVIDMLIVTNEEAIDGFNQMQTSIADLEDKKNNMEKMTDRFNELSQKIYKTNEELDEMRQLMKDINAQAGEEVIAANFSVNTAALQAYYDDLDSRITESRTKASEFAQQMIGTTGLGDFFRTKDRERDLHMERYRELSDANQQGFLDYSITDMLGEQFDNMTSQERLEYQSRIQQMSRVLEQNMGQLAKDAKMNLTEYMDYISKNPILTVQDLDSFETLLADPAKFPDLIAKYNTLNDTQKKFFEGMYYGISQINELINSTDLNEQDVVNIGGFETMQQYLAMLSDPDLGLSADSIVAFVKTIGDTMKSGGTATDGFTAAMDNLRNSSTATSNELQKLYNIMYSFIVSDNQSITQSLNKMTSSVEEAEKVMKAFNNFNQGIIDEDVIGILTNYPNLYDKIVQGTLRYRDVIQEVATITQEELGKKAANALVAMSQASANSEKAAYNLYRQEYINYMLMSEQYETFMKFNSDKIEALDSEINLLKEVNKERKDEVDFLEKKYQMQQSQLDLDRRIAALQKDSSISARAELAKLEEQRRAALIDQEQFLTDSFVDTRISTIENEKTDLMVRQQEQSNEFLAQILEKIPEFNEGQLYDRYEAYRDDVFAETGMESTVSFSEWLTQTGSITG
jgi:TP901 family phage tail tape measure protein